MRAAPPAAVALEIEPEDLSALRRSGAPHTVLDVREPWETQICVIEGSLALPLGSLPQSLDRVPQGRPLIVVCHLGMRSLQAAMWLRGQGYENATSLRGGIDAWARQVEPTMTTY